MWTLAGNYQNVWVYFAVVVQKINALQTKICLQYATQGQTCNTINTVFTDSGTMEMIVGESLIGHVRNLRLRDWPKPNHAT